MKKQAENLTGKKFGRLTAISLAEPHVTKGGQRRTRWLCRCECGRERVVMATRLKSGATTHCGYCKPVDGRLSKNRPCRFCEYSDWDKNAQDWKCSQGVNPTTIKDSCEKYWCGAYDKVSGLSNRQSKCYICGNPVYSHGTDTPIYCKDHREYAEMDDEAIKNAPYILLFSLIAGIFLRARDDYLFNADNKRSDAEVFLRSNWAQTLSLSSFDANEVLRQLNEVMEDESE